MGQPKRDERHYPLDELFGVAVMLLGGWVLVHSLGSLPLPLVGQRGSVLLRLVVALVLLVSISIAIVVWWRRWFPHRATRELNVLLSRTRVIGDAKLIRRKCRRRGHQWEIAWRVPTGVTTSGLMNAREVMEHALDCSALFWYERGLMWMRAGTAQLPKVIDYDTFYASRRPDGELVIAIGYGRIGPVWADLARIPHMLVGGTPGSGKSVFLRQVVVGLVERYGPDLLKLVVVDLKGGMEFHLFQQLPHLLVPVVSDLPQLVPALEAVLGELDRRMAMFAADGVVSLQQWNERHPGDRLPYILVFVDEYGEVSLPGAEGSNDQARARSPKAMHAAFSRIARLGRAVGIHLVACTQRPDVEVMPGQIKDQLPATVAFKTRSAVNSHILLGDRNDAAALLSPYEGRAVFQWKGEQEVQAPWLSPEVAAAKLREQRVQGVGHDRVTQCPTRNQDEPEAA